MDIAMNDPARLQHLVERIFDVGSADFAMDIEKLWQRFAARFNDCPTGHCFRGRVHERQMSFVVCYEDTIGHARERCAELLALRRCFSLLDALARLSSPPEIACRADCAPE